MTTNTPITDALADRIGMQPRATLIYSDLRAMTDLARKLETDRAALIAALENLCNSLALPLDDSGRRIAITTARAALATVQS